MAKKSQIARDLKRRKLYEKYAEKRAQLKAEGNLEELAKLPRNSSPTRLNNRCMQTGRSRSYIRKYGLSRVAFRDHASKGEIPGIKKSSW